MSHEHGHDWAGANQKFFDSEAKAADTNPEYVKMGEAAVKALVDTYPHLFNKEKTMVLDFACGSGLVSRPLLAHAKSIVGVDISQGQVDQYNDHAKELGIATTEMHAIQAELAPDTPALAGQKYDVIICTAAYHHIPDIQYTTRTLASYLVPGGSLLVIDFLKHDGPDAFKHAFAHAAEVDPSIDAEKAKAIDAMVAHKSGFDETDMKKLFEDAGLGGWEWKEEAMIAHVHGMHNKCFLAKGTKA